MAEKFNMDFFVEYLNFYMYRCQIKCTVFLMV